MKIDIKRIKALQEGKVSEKYNTLEQYTDLQLIEVVLDWSDTKENFDPKFIESVAEFYEKNKKITSGQRLALENIINSFEIDIESFLSR